MRKLIIASVAAAAFSLTACSEKTQDAAAEATAEAADATAEAAKDAGNAVEGTVNAAGDAAAAAGDKIETETAKAAANDEKK